MKLKILTQNLHCLVEKDIEDKQKLIADEIIKKDVDIVFLQEVAQTKCDQTKGIKTMPDNYGLKLLELLEKAGFKAYFYYEPIKESFGIYDEGVGIISKYPLEQVKTRYISKIREYSDWKSRKVLTGELHLNHQKILLATTHFGWSDGYEVFEEQFDLATKDIPDNAKVILAGDYNIQTDSKEYAYIISKKWIDIFKNNRTYFNKPTFRGGDDINNDPVRLDYIMTKQPVKLLDQEIVFIEQRVSDHYGVYVEIEI